MNWKTAAAAFLWLGFSASVVPAFAASSDLAGLVSQDFGAATGPLGAIVRKDGKYSDASLEKLVRRGDIAGYHRAGAQLLRLDLPEGGLLSTLDLFYSGDGSLQLAVSGLLASNNYDLALGRIEDGPRFTVLSGTRPTNVGTLGVVRATETQGVFLTTWINRNPGLLGVLDEAAFWPLCGSAPRDLAPRILVFRQVRSTSSWTLPARGLTSVFTDANGARQRR